MTMPIQKCTNCGKPVDEKYRPFCSKHCADVDLARWFGERYAIPTEESPLNQDDYGDGQE